MDYRTQRKIEWLASRYEKLSEGCDFRGTPLVIGDEVVFKGNNGQWIKGTIASIYGQKVGENYTYMRFFKNTRNILYEYHYVIHTDSNRWTDRLWYDILKLD